MITAIAAGRLVAQPPAPAMRTAEPDTLRLTVEDARALAQRQNPDLAVASLDVAIAQGQLRQARAIRANPFLDVLAGGPGGTGPELSLAQEVEVAGQRGLRTAAAEAELTRTRFTTADRTRLVIHAVDRAFYTGVRRQSPRRTVARRAGAE
ncbi:MAG: hypothetical protein HYX65_01095 [Gemmatimonadetes bacterium]|nr:hypothetical protein [Gemmatimonadota bacterium]